MSWQRPLHISEKTMNEWIIAPLLAADGTATHRPGSNGSNGSEVGKDKQDEPTEERRHGDRRDNHDDEVDPDFARGDDRRDDVP